MGDTSGNDNTIHLISQQRTQFRQTSYGFDGEMVRFTLLIKFSVRPIFAFAVEPGGVHAGLLGGLGV